MQIQQPDASPRHAGVSPKNAKEIFRYRVSQPGHANVKAGGSGSQAASAHGTITYAGVTRKQ